MKSPRWITKVLVFYAPPPSQSATISRIAGITSKSRSKTCKDFCKSIIFMPLKTAIVAKVCRAVCILMVWLTPGSCAITFYSVLIREWHFSKCLCMLSGFAWEPSGSSTGNIKSSNCCLEHSPENLYLTRPQTSQKSKTKRICAV